MRMLVVCDHGRMSQRHRLQDGDYMFITTVTHRREPFFMHDGVARIAVEMLYHVKERRPFLLFGFVVMPDHCHFLLKVDWPQKISNVMNIYKSRVAFHAGIGPLWQPRFHMQVPKHLDPALNYIHQNPVRAGLAPSPAHYPWSSASGKWDVDPLPSIVGL